MFSLGSAYAAWTIRQCHQESKLVLSLDRVCDCCARHFRRPVGQRLERVQARKTLRARVIAGRSRVSSQFNTAGSVTRPTEFQMLFSLSWVPDGTGRQSASTGFGGTFTVAFSKQGGSLPMDTNIREYGWPAPAHFSFIDHPVGETLWLLTSSLT